MVAWLIHAGATLFGETEFGIRSGALLCGAIASVYVYRLTRDLFDDDSALVALVLMQALPFFFFSGLMMTPDVPLTAAWAALLFYLEQALIRGRASAWWRAGLCLGLGLLSKYTILMLAPVAFIFMVWDAQSRRWLRHWLPYAALVLALVIFSPGHLLERDSRVGVLRLSDLATARGVAAFLPPQAHPFRAGVADPGGRAESGRDAVGKTNCSGRWQ